MNTDDLRALLVDRSELIDTNSEPRTDEVLGRVQVQRRRRTAGALMGAACLVLAMVGAGAVIARQSADPAEPSGPTKTETPDGTPDAQPQPRKLAWTDDYWSTTSFHYGGQRINIRPQVEHILDNRPLARRTWFTMDVTDAGVGFHVTDGKVWFADGTGVEQIGDLGGHITSYSGGLTSGSSGPLLVWIQTTAKTGSELVVYDTELRSEVARQRVPDCDRWGCEVGPVVGEDHVYWTVGDRESRDFGTYDGPPTMLDIATGEQTEVTRRDLAADLASRPRGLIVGESAETGEVTNGLNEQRFEVRGDRLVPTLYTDSREVFTDTKVFDTGTGKQLRLKAPAVDQGSPEFIMFEWVDDDRSR